MSLSITLKRNDRPVAVQCSDNMDVEESDDIMEFRDQVRETLEDVLPSKKMADVTDTQILSVLETHFKRENTDMDMDYDYKYFPLKIVDLTVKEIVSSMASPPLQKELDSSSDPEEEEDFTMAPTMKDILIPLSSVYPDIDPTYLKTIIDKFSGNTSSIQEYLEDNIETIPERRTIQAVQYRMISSNCDNSKRERPWQCPQCRSWSTISLPKSLDTVKKEPQFDLECAEIVSCGSFCYYCNRKSHAPFKCRTTTTRVLQAENEMDIFKKLDMLPDEVRASIRIYNMKPKNDTNFANPLDILYTTAEGTFLRMLKRGGGHSFDRNFIKEIKYFENDALAERFNESKKRLEAQGITCKERLVFHGTPVNSNVEAIFQDGLLLSKCKRFAHGYGIYFSEFPDVSQVYGQNLLLCRVLVGRPYIEGRVQQSAPAPTNAQVMGAAVALANMQGGVAAAAQAQRANLLQLGHRHWIRAQNQTAKNIPDGYNSKFVSPDVDGKAQMIVIDKEDQILPAFQIVTQGRPGN